MRRKQDARARCQRARPLRGARVDDARRRERHDDQQREPDAPGGDGEWRRLGEAREYRTAGDGEQRDAQHHVGRGPRATARRWHRRWAQAMTQAGTSRQPRVRSPSSSRQRGSCDSTRLQKRREWFMWRVWASSWMRR